MKKTVLAFVLLAALALAPVFAQDEDAFAPPPPAPVPAAPVIAPAQSQSQTVNFASERPQFIYFALGVPMGFNLQTDDMHAGRNFSIGFVVIDNMTVGFDHLHMPGAFESGNMMRIGYFFSDTLGAAFGIGNASGTTNVAGTMQQGAAITMGLMANLFQGRSSIGLTHALRVRIDYAAMAEHFAYGTVVFTFGVGFGL
ncbi:MAG: hypothetical protein FWG66_01275 [Spirochaetes bacterium]|nr:hypothetical protein [Spirochaetota bacterium]